MPWFDRAVGADDQPEQRSCARLASSPQRERAVDALSAARWGRNGETASEDPLFNGLCTPDTFERQAALARLTRKRAFSQTERRTRKGRSTTPRSRATSRPSPHSSTGALTASTSIRTPPPRPTASPSTRGSRRSTWPIPTRQSSKERCGGTTARRWRRARRTVARWG